MLKKRFNEIDVAKAIGIFCIVFGHTLTDGWVREFLYAFDVPVFFLLSGLVFKFNPNWADFLKKKFFRLYLPYFVVSVLSLVIFLVASQFFGNYNSKFDIQASPLECFLGILYGNSRVLGEMRWNQPLWFLPCLILCVVAANAIFWLFNKTKMSEKQIIVFKVIIVLVCFIVAKFFVDKEICLFFGVESAVYMFVFFMFGNLISTIYFKYRDKFINKKVIFFIVFMCLAIIVFYGADWNWFGQVRTMSLGRLYYCYTLLAMLGSFMVLSLAIVLRNIKFIQKVGISSLFILLFHKFFIVFFQSFVPITKLYLSQVDTFPSLMSSLLVTLITVAVLTCIYCLYKKFILKIL